jgi:hypothetical protein
MDLKINNLNLLIDECEKLAEETGRIHFLFDIETSLKIKKFKENDKENDKENKRDILLSELIGDEIYEVADENSFREMPSRFSYYDTETKLTCRYKKHNYAIDWFKKIGFTPNLHNYGAEYENSFILDLENNEKLIIRLQPNLTLKLIHASELLITIYSGFFSKFNMLSAIEKSITNSKSIVRDAKLEIVFEKEKENL